MNSSERKARQKRWNERILNYLKKRTNKKNIISTVKMVILFAIYVFYTMCLARHEIDLEENSIITLLPGRLSIVPIEIFPKENRVAIEIEGSFFPTSSKTSDFNVKITCQKVQDGAATQLSTVWNVAIDTSKVGEVHQLSERAHTFYFADQNIGGKGVKLQFQFETNFGSEFPIIINIDSNPIDQNMGSIYGVILLVFLYVLIIWEFVHRTFAAMLCSTLGIGILACLDHKPSMERIFGWVNAETLLLLFGMMILVAVLSETGLFDYLAVLAYRMTRGKVWPLITCLCFFTGLVSAFLDNVTTVLLMTPVSIRLCEVLFINPRPVLIGMVIYSNIGGAMTPVGDPPNVIIASNSYVRAIGVDFIGFVANMFAGSIIVFVETYLHFRLYCRFTKCLDFAPDKNHEIRIWKKTAARTGSITLDEEMVREQINQKVDNLKKNLTATEGGEIRINYRKTLGDLQVRYPILNRILLIKAGCVLIVVIALFCLHSLPGVRGLDLGWVALLGAILLLILHEVEDFEALLSHVEWATLLFFFALFVLMECLTELGLIDWIGIHTEQLILHVTPKYQLLVALLLILWVSAVVSAFVDNIPLTTMMIKVVIELAENEELHLPARPLVFALALGACLGGNGTLIGASANVVTAGIAAQHGYDITFYTFFKLGFQIMIVNMLFVSAFLLIAYVLCKWY